MGIAIRKTFFTIVRLILGSLFVWAGWIKWQNTVSFADKIASYHMVPLDWVEPMSIGIPLAEMALGTLIIIGFWMEVAAMGLVILVGLFMIAMTYASVKGYSISCGCFGELTKGWTVKNQLWFDTGIIFAFTALIKWPDTYFALDDVWLHLKRKSDQKEKKEAKSKVEPDDVA